MLLGRRETGETGEPAPGGCNHTGSGPGSHGTDLFSSTVPSAGSSRSLTLGQSPPTTAPAEYCTCELQESPRSALFLFSSSFFSRITKRGNVRTSAAPLIHKSAVHRPRKNHPPLPEVAIGFSAGALKNSMSFATPPNGVGLSLLKLATVPQPTDPPAAIAIRRITKCDPRMRGLIPSNTMHVKLSCRLLSLRTRSQ
jgi:hypothetical protein